MPSFCVTSAGVRSPEPAAPIQCTSGHAGCALATPAERPTAAAPATAAAQVNVVETTEHKTPTLLVPRPGDTRYTSPQESQVLRPPAVEIDEMAAIHSHFCAHVSVWAKKVGSDTEQRQEKRRRRRRQPNRRRRRKLRQPDRRGLRQPNLRHPDWELRQTDRRRRRHLRQSDLRGREFGQRIQTQACSGPAAWADPTPAPASGDPAAPGGSPTMRHPAMPAPGYPTVNYPHRRWPL